MLRRKALKISYSKAHPLRDHLYKNPYSCIKVLIKIPKWYILIFSKLKIFKTWLYMIQFSFRFWNVNVNVFHYSFLDVVDRSTSLTVTVAVLDRYHDRSWPFLTVPERFRPFYECFRSFVTFMAVLIITTYM